jgi:hypothetical protein
VADSRSGVGHFCRPCCFLLSIPTAHSGDHLLSDETPPERSESVLRSRPVSTNSDRASTPDDTGTLRRLPVLEARCPEHARESVQANSFRKFYAQQCASRHRFLRSAEPDIHLQSRALKGPSQKIEFVFSASPETIRREPRESDLLRSVGKMQDLAVCAFYSSCFFRQYFYAAEVLRSSAGTKSLCCRSTASKYATIFRATASVARLLFPFCLSWS